MTLLSVPSFWQPLVIGLIILFGVILDTYRRRFSEVRRAVQALRSKAGRRLAQGNQVSPTAVVEDGKRSALKPNFRSGSREKDKS
jgi:ribose transport system permease protein